MKYLKRISAILLLLSFILLIGCQQIQDIFNPTVPTEAPPQTTEGDSTSATEDTSETEPTEQTTEPSTEPPQNGLKEGSSLVYTENSGDPSNGKAVNISISLPQFTGEASQSVNEYMRERFDIIKASALSLKDTSDPLRGGGMDYEYGYSLNFSSGYINIIQSEYSFITGSAHPNHNKYADNFNAATGQRILLSDLFKEKTEYVRVLAEHCYDIMYSDPAKYDYVGSYSREEIDADNSLRSEVKDACVAAVSDNTFIVNEEGITLIFNPYEIAPYALGTIEVTVPWTDLSDIKR